MREFFQNIIALRSVCGGQDLLSGSVRPGCPDIFQKALFKQPGILKHKGCLFHQVFRIHFFDIDAPDGDGAAVCIPEAGNEACCCRLASPGGPYQRCHLTGPDSKRYIGKSRAVRAGVGKGHMVKGYSGICRTFLYPCVFHRFLAQDLIQASHGFIRLHDSLAHVHDAVDHLAAGRSEQGIEDKVDKHRAHVPAGGQQQSRRDQQGESSVDKCQETGLPHTAAHGVLAGKVAVVPDGRIESFERVHGLLEHFYHGDAPDIFHRLAAHALDLLLIAVEKAGVLSAHHQAHGQQRQHHGEQAQKPHFPVKEEEHQNGGNGSDDRSRQVRQLVGKQIFCKTGIVVDQFPEPSGLTAREESKRQLQDVPHGSAPDIPGRAEGRDMSGHERCKIQNDTYDCGPYRRPAPAGRPGHSGERGPGFQDVPCRKPYAHIGDQPQYRGQGGEDTAQQGEISVPARITQDAGKAALLFLLQMITSLLFKIYIMKLEMTNHHAKKMGATAPSVSAIRLYKSP